MRTVRQSEMPRTAWMKLEGELDDFANFHQVRIPVIDPHAWRGHPLNRLHEAAAKFSATLKRVPLPAEPPEPDPAPPKPKLHAGHELAAKSMAWLSREHPHAKTRKQQYALLKLCPVYKGLVIPKPDAWETYCRGVRRHAQRHPDVDPDVVE